MKQLNLNTEKNKLTENDIGQICAIIGKGCRIKTYSRLVSILTYGSGTIGNYGIYDRLMKDNGQWSYCAGQSYTDEIRTLRECILGKV